MAAGPALQMWSRGEREASSDDGRRRAYRATIAFTVTLDAGDIDDVAYQAAGLPLVGSSLPNVPLCICRNLRVQRVSPILAIVTAAFSGEIGPGAIAGSSPINNPVQIEWGASITDEPIDEDINGSPIVTANNEPIDGLTERVPDLVATVTRNFLDIDTFAISQYLRSRNSDTFLGWPAGTVRLMDYRASRTWGSNQETGFWTVSATFQFRVPYNTTPERAWWKRVRHEGFVLRASADSEDIFHGEDDGDPAQLLSRPVLLKASGTRERNPENAHFLEFETTLALPYNALGLV